LRKKEGELIELKNEYQNSGFFTGLRNNITAVCKRRNRQQDDRDGNPMSMFHDDVEDL